VEALRAIKREPTRGEVVSLSACDPLNLVGTIVPGDRVPATMGNAVTYGDGLPVLDVGEVAAPPAMQRTREINARLAPP